MVLELWCEDREEITLKMMFGIKYNIEPFDGKNNFSISHSTIKDVLVYQGLFKALQGKKLEKMINEE